MKFQAYSVCLVATVLSLSSCIDTSTDSAALNSSSAKTNLCQIGGDVAQWHRMNVTCSGFHGSENEEATFTDIRFDITFSQGDTVIKIPGHFAADGNASESSAIEGDKWRAYFSPPTTGDWQYKVSFRQGANIAVSASDNEGQAINVFNGESGQFNVAKVAVEGQDMRGRGLLQHNKGEKYLRFAGDNSIYIQAGMDSPENIFGYYEFDNTIKHNNVKTCKGILHKFEPHADDWATGDPTWQNGKGKNLIGLINYIAENGVNSAYIMANTVNGDGCDAHPWSIYDGNRKAFDVSKLDQWEIALSHMTQQGLLIHMMTQETENDQLLNDGDLGFERKLYYRELISRFGHHPALQWNIGEENTNTVEQRKAFSDYIRIMDPYNHAIFMHTYPSKKHYADYYQLLGHPTFDGPTFQMADIPPNASNTKGTYGKTLDWLRRSKDAGNQWIVTMTEAAGKDAPKPNVPISSLQRIYWMWANVMAGGGGFEWYLKNDGGGHTHAYDLAVEDLREFDTHWQQSGHLAHFFRDIVQNELKINLSSLSPNNDLTLINSDWVLADPGEAYIIYLREGGSTDVMLLNSNTFKVLWYNPRTGKKTEGRTLQGDNKVQNIGMPPTETDQDWAAIVVAS
ncbi:DUF5060 domain-containing protein [Paraglaciecola sp.]|uniref:DUF5060 domain-containing protein n=1 Tax=Paraglaciecola sp. TaxID=1920173 RepID=UPI003EF8C6CE